MNYTRTLQDVDGEYLAFKHFVEIADQLVIYDRGPAANDAQLLATADGVTWAQLVSIPAAIGGNSFIDDGGGFSVIGDSLFVSLYRSDPTKPKILEYNTATGALTAHLPNPTAGGQDNYFGGDQAIWDRNLWVVTDTTTFVSNRRVVYYYDGTAWTAIVDYDGAAYLDYNRADANSPANAYKHRTTRLFVFNDTLYLLASRWSGTKWAWEAWEFDAENYDNFTLIYDSSVLDDNFALIGVLEFEGRVKVVGQLLETNGNPTGIGKLYSSDDMTTWTEESEFVIFDDEFSDAFRDYKWTDEANSGSVTEAAGLLTLAVPALTNGNWWQPNIENSPFVKYTPAEDELVIITKLNNYVVNDQTNAGLIIGTTTTIPDAAGGYCYAFCRARSGGTNGLQVIDIGNGALATNAVTTLPIWLRLRISGSGAGSVIAFDYSTDNITWTTLHTLNNATWTFVGLFAKNWGVFNAISAPFEFFHIRSLLGYPCGEASFDGLIYLNCLDFLDTETKIKYYDGRLRRFIEDVDITTNTNALRGGGLAPFGGNLHVGKYREIYRGDGPVEQPIRMKKRSQLLAEVGYKDKLGTKYTDYITFIDTRAYTRFYEGRIKAMSNVPRAVDDKTGLFNVSDVSMSLLNNDMKYSKLLSNRIFKNQVTKLFHIFGDQPERRRTHFITLVCYDHSLEGPEFHIKFKDITQQYFDTKIPTEICTADEFPDIHPDAVGKAKPEVLGNAYCLTGKDLGAVEAVYIDTVGPPYRYLASRGQLNSIDQVYADNVLLATPADYTVTLATPSLINMTADHGDERITYNGKGYMIGAWNSAAGYIQNPAYVICYLLRYIMGIPFSFLDMNYFDNEATYFEDIGWGTAAYFVLQDRHDAMEILRQLLYCPGSKGFTALDGKFRIESKNFYVFDTNLFMFVQTDLENSARRLWNLPNAINTIKKRWQYIPWQRRFVGADEVYKENDYGAIMEDDTDLPKEYLPV